MDYISRDELLALYTLNDPVLNEACHVPLPVIRQNIMDMPAADVAPVRHGRWIDAESDDGCTVWHCSKCSYPIKTICGYPIYKYCPMCGALMDGKEDEDGQDPIKRSASDH